MVRVTPSKPFRGYPIPPFHRLPALVTIPTHSSRHWDLKAHGLPGQRESVALRVTFYSSLQTTACSLQPCFSRVSDPENPRNPTPPSPPHPHSLGVINTAVPTGRAKLLEANRRWRPHTVQTRPASECKQIFCILRIFMQCHHHLICT